MRSTPLSLSNVRWILPRFPVSGVTHHPSATAGPGRGGSVPVATWIRSAWGITFSASWPRSFNVRNTLISTAWVAAPFWLWSGWLFSVVLRLSRGRAFVVSATRKVSATERIEPARLVRHVAPSITRRRHVVSFPVGPLSVSRCPCLFGSGQADYTPRDSCTERPRSSASRACVTAVSAPAPSPIGRCPKDNPASAASATSAVALPFGYPRRFRRSRIGQTPSASRASVAGSGIMPPPAGTELPMLRFRAM